MDHGHPDVRRPKGTPTSNCCKLAWVCPCKPVTVSQQANISKSNHEFRDVGLQPDHHLPLKPGNRIDPRYCFVGVPGTVPLWIPLLGQRFLTCRRTPGTPNRVPRVPRPERSRSTLASTCRRCWGLYLAHEDIPGFRPFFWGGREGVGGSSKT